VTELVFLNLCCIRYTKCSRIKSLVQTERVQPKIFASSDRSQRVFLGI